MSLTRAARLKILRILAGYNVKDLANALKVSSPTISQWEREGPKGLVPSNFLLPQLANFLGVSPEYLREDPVDTHGVVNCIWLPIEPRPVHYQRAMAADIIALFPELLAENELNFGDSAKLADGFAYLLGRDSCKTVITREQLPPAKRAHAVREDREFFCLLLVTGKLEGCFQEAFRTYKKINFSAGQSLQQYTLDSFDWKSLQLLASGGNYARIDFQAFTTALESSKNKPECENLLVKKTNLRDLIFSFLYATNHDRLSNETISKLSNLFMEKAGTDLASEFDLSSDIFKILNKNG